MTDNEEPLQVHMAGGELLFEEGSVHLIQSWAQDGSDLHTFVKLGFTGSINKSEPRRVETDTIIMTVAEASLLVINLTDQIFEAHTRGLA